MGLPRNLRVLKNAKHLRKNLTNAERKVWFEFLREYPHHFVYQKIIGTYIVDFFCNKVRLSIELDGSQHYEQSHIKYDQTRTTFLEMLEIKELRFSNADVFENFDGVCERIHIEVQKRRNDLVELPISTLIHKS